MWIGCRVGRGAVGLLPGLFVERHLSRRGWEVGEEMEGQIVEGFASGREGIATLR